MLRYYITVTEVRWYTGIVTKFAATSIVERRIAMNETRKTYQSPELLLVSAPDADILTISFGDTPFVNFDW